MEKDTPGVVCTQLDKTGWLCSDTATIHFDDCRFASENLLGSENGGFRMIMENFNAERIFLSGQCVYFSQLLIEEATAWANARRTFGKRLIDHQVIRHTLVDMATRTAAAEAYLDGVVAKFSRDEASCVADISMLKNFSTDCFHFCADKSVQILGGAGYIRGSNVERLYRETKVMQIGGGSTEIMKDLAAKQLGLAD